MNHINLRDNKAINLLNVRINKAMKLLNLRVNKAIKLLNLRVNQALFISPLIIAPLIIIIMKNLILKSVHMKDVINLSDSIKIIVQENSVMKRKRKRNSYDLKKNIIRKIIDRLGFLWCLHPINRL